MTALVALDEPGGGYKGVDVVTLVPALGTDEAASAATFACPADRGCI